MFDLDSLSSWHDGPKNSNWKCKRKKMRLSNCSGPSFQVLCFSENNSNPRIRWATPSPTKHIYIDCMIDLEHTSSGSGHRVFTHCNCIQIQHNYRAHDAETSLIFGSLSSATWKRDSELIMEKQRGIAAWQTRTRLVLSNGNAYAYGIACCWLDDDPKQMCELEKHFFLHKRTQ